MIPLSTYLKQYRVGDIVDVVANGAVQKGMVCLAARPDENMDSADGTLTSCAALQGLPRQDRRRLQRDQVRSRCHPLPTSRQPLH